MPEQPEQSGTGAHRSVKRDRVRRRHSCESNVKHWWHRQAFAITQPTISTTALHKCFTHSDAYVITRRGAARRGGLTREISYVDWRPARRWPSWRSPRLCSSALRGSTPWRPWCRRRLWRRAARRRCRAVAAGASPTAGRRRRESETSRPPPSDICPADWSARPSPRSGTYRQRTDEISSRDHHYTAVTTSPAIRRQSISCLLSTINTVNSSFDQMFSRLYHTVTVQWRHQLLGQSRSPGSASHLALRTLCHEMYNKNVVTVFVQLTMQLCDLFVLIK